MNDVLAKPRALTPEAIKLINDGALKPQTGKPADLPTAAVVSSAATKTPTPAPALPDVSKDTAALSDRANEVRIGKNKAKVEAEPKAEALVSVYVRLPSDIHLAVIKAATDRKLNKQRLASQQAIVTEALTKWLQATGYFK